MNTEDLLYQEKWYAVHTKNRHEKQIHTRLEQKGVHSFLPLRKLQRKWKDRKKIVEFPLFPGYIFVRIPLIEKAPVIQTKGVVKIVGIPSPTPIPENQIEAVKLFLQYDIEVDPYPEYTPGKEIEIKKGPFKGVRGFLVRKKGTYRLVVNLEIISQAVSTEIDVDDVKLV